MKRLCLILLIFNVSFTNAQYNFELGIQSGSELNFPSSPNKTVIENYEVRPGFNVGIKFRHNFGIHSFVWGFEYAQMSFIYRYPTGNFDPTAYHPKYLSLYADQFRMPLLYQINVGKKRSQFFINGGPCVLFGLKKYPSVNEMTFGDNENTPIYPRELVKEINIGFMTGMGYSYKPLPWVRLFTETHFTVPFFTSDLNVRALGLSWSLGVSFKTSKQ